MDADDKKFIGLLIAVCLITVFVCGLAVNKLERENARLHAAVDASTVPPSTNYVRTR